MTPDAAHHVFVLSVMALATIVAVAAMRIFAGARRARATPAAITATATLEALRGDVGEMKTRLAAVETMLREVG